VAIGASEQHLGKATDILERHNPIDIDERAASYSSSGTTMTRTTGAPPTAGTAATTGTAAARSSTDGEAVHLAEEHLAAGATKRCRSTGVLSPIVTPSPTPTSPIRWSR
jgi:hypothetical protein